MAVISPDLALGDVPPREGDAAGPARAATTRPTFEQAYDQLFDFVWRSLRRLGVPAASIDDAVQDVFVVVHRRLVEFEGRSSLKTWVFAIALRVARDHQRSARRKGGHEPLDPRIADDTPGPVESLARAEAVRELDRILAALDEDKRTVFVLAEIEQMTAPEIAEALGINLNTVYSRLRLARRAFEAHAAAGGKSR